MDSIGVEHQFKGSKESDARDGTALIKDVRFHLRLYFLRYLKYVFESVLP